MAHQCAFDLGGADTVAGDIEHIVDAPDDPEITVLVLPAAIAGKVDGLDFAPINGFIALRVPPEAPQHCGPGLADNEFAAAVAWNGLSIFVDHLRNNAEERKRGRAGLGGSSSRQRSDHRAAGLGLPPRIHDRTTFAANNVVVPNP